MVAEKSYIKGKLRYWFILVAVVLIMTLPVILTKTQPENFVKDEMSDYNGVPVVNCAINESYMSHPGDVFVKKGGNRCLIEKIPMTTQFSREHPFLQLVVFDYGNLIGIVLILFCFLPNKKLKEIKKNELEAKERESIKEDRETKAEDSVQGSEAVGQDKSQERD